MVLLTTISFHHVDEYVAKRDNSERKIRKEKRKKRIVNCCDKKDLNSFLISIQFNSNRIQKRLFISLTLLIKEY